MVSDDVIEKLTSRKFIVAVLVTLTTAAPTAFRILDGSLYATVIIATVGAYLTANVVDKRPTTGS